MDYHLNDLRRELNSSDWEIFEESSGNGYDISGSWRIRKQGMEYTLCFYGLDDLECLPLEKAYACYLAENKKISLYFSRKSRSWSNEVIGFLKELNQVI